MWYGCQNRMSLVVFTDIHFSRFPYIVSFFFFFFNFKSGLSNSGQSQVEFTHNLLFRLPINLSGFPTEKEVHSLSTLECNSQHGEHSELQMCFLSESNLRMSFECKIHNGWFRGAWGGCQFDLMRIVAGLAPPPPPSPRTKSGGLAWKVQSTHDSAEGGWQRCLWPLRRRQQERQVFRQSANERPECG